MIEQPKKTRKEKWMEFKLDLKKFIYYLITEPVRQFKSITNISFHKALSLTKTYTWIWVWGTFVVVFFITNDSKLKYVFLALLVIFIIKYEWERGLFRKRWKDHYLDKAKHMYEKNKEI